MKDEKRLFCLNQFNTILGLMHVCATPRGICFLEFEDTGIHILSQKKLFESVRADFMYGENIHTENLKNELTAYFESRLHQFYTPLDPIGTNFQISVWNELTKIPYGQMRSYKQLAESIEKPGAVRAIGRANGMNKIAILIPCHRVIGHNGDLTGYSGGLWRKKWLLNLEGNKDTGSEGLKGPLTLFSENKSALNIAD